MGGNPQEATPERLSAFSDAVFAVLITILVLDLRPPELPTFKALLLLWPTWLSYAVSYVFIAIGAPSSHISRYCISETFPCIAVDGKLTDKIRALRDSHDVYLEGEAGGFR